MEQRYCFEAMFETIDITPVGLLSDLADILSGFVDKLGHNHNRHPLL